jgi:hypothetical protein
MSFVIGPSALPAEHDDRARQRALGIVYTPPAVARAMVARALAPILERGVALRVCDPAMGDGVFLRAVIDVLADATGASRREIAERCVAGVDVDAATVAAARAAIAADTGADPARLQLAVGDALTGFAWDGAFCGFDAVVGNPPYVRQERFTGGKRALRGYAAYDGVADLYVYFLELAHRIARPGGRYCWIVPNKWMTAAYGAPLRRFLADARSVEGIVDLGRGLRVFDGVDAFPCVLWGTIGGAGALEAIAARDVAHGLEVIAGAGAGGDAIERTAWQDAPWHIDDARGAAQIHALETRWPALGELLAGRPARGLVTGCNAAFVIDADTRAQLIARDPASAELIRPFVKGRDVRAWTPADAARWILVVAHGTELARYPAIAAHLARFREQLEPKPAAHTGPWPGRKPGRYRWHELQDPVGALAAGRATRLLVQDIQSAAFCCIDPGDRVPDTTVWMLPTADPVILAILNSPVYWWYARRRFPPALGGAVRPKLDYLRRFPIAQPAPARRTAITSLVHERIVGGPNSGLERTIADHVLAAYELSHEEVSI